MNRKSDLNKYAKKTPELQKKLSSFKTEQKKEGCFEEGYFICLSS